MLLPLLKSIIHFYFLLTIQKIGKKYATHCWSFELLNKNFQTLIMSQKNLTSINLGRVIAQNDLSCKNYLSKTLTSFNLLFFKNAFDEKCYAVLGKIGTLLHTNLSVDVHWLILISLM